MPDFAKPVRQVLAEHGCQFVRHGKGDHDIWRNPASGRSFTVPVTLKSRHLANEILKQAGIAVKV